MEEDSILTYRQGVTRSSRSWMSVAAGALVIFAGACSFGVDFDEFVRGNPPGSVPPDGSAADAAGEGSTGDGSTGDGSTDGSTDAAEILDAGSFCLGRGPHTVCEDFDGKHEAGWTYFEQASGATGTVSPGAFVSPPNSLFITRPADAGRFSGVVLSKLLEPTTKAVAVEADVMGYALGEGYANILYLLDTNAPPNLVTFGIEANNGSPQSFVIVSIDGQGKLYPAGAPLPVDRFAHVRFEVALSATAGSIRVTIDNAVRLDLPSLPTSSSTATGRSFNAGFLSGETSDTFNVRLDNIVVDATK